VILDAGMLTPVRRLDPVAGIGAGLAALRTALAALPAAPGVLRRLEAPVTGRIAALDLPAGLPDDHPGPRWLLGRDWSGAGALVEREVGDPAAIAAPPPPLRLAVSCAFDPVREPSPGWRPFGRCRTWLPLLELDGADGLLALNWLDDGDLDRDTAAALLSCWREPAAAAAPPSVAWQDQGEARATWHATVAAALARIADTEALPLARKIVAARRLAGRLAAPARPADLLRAARPGDGGWPWWLARGDHHWLGETPELLGVRDGTCLATEALAGTRPRDPDPSRDAALADQLLASDKDRREQAAVADWLHRQLSTLAGRTPTIGDLEVHALPSLQHLRRTLAVTTDAPLTDAAWLDALHPTPALCGVPRREVRAWLRAAEPFDRGLYGGFLARVAADRSEAHVAIRGLRLRGREAMLYAGAGLVRGSDPTREWDETRAKIAAVCRRCGLDPPAEEAT
jgi:menaquinone-specific isochorismate synthase